MDTKTLFPDLQLQRLGADSGCSGEEINRTKSLLLHLPHCVTLCVFREGLSVFLFTHRPAQSSGIEVLIRIQREGPGLTQAQTKPSEVTQEILIQKELGNAFLLLTPLFFCLWHSNKAINFKTSPHI